MQLFGKAPSEVRKQVQAEVTRRKAAMARRNKYFKVYDRLYYLQHYGEKKEPGSIKAAKGIAAQVNDATTQVDTMRNLIGAKNLRIKVFPRWISSGELEAASEQERWLWAVLEANNDRHETAEILDEVLFDTLRLGWGVTYSRWDNEVAQQSMMTFPTPDGQGFQAVTECPILIEKVSPYFIYPEMGGPQGRWRSHLVIEPNKSALEIYEEWGRKPKALEKARAGEEHLAKVKDYVVYWGWERIEDKWYVVNCVMADDDIMREPLIMENYDALPITLFFCVPTGDPRWEFMSLSMLFPIHLHVKLLDHLMSRLHKRVDQVIGMPLFRTKSPGGQSAPLNIQKGIFNIIDLEPGEKAPEFPKAPGADPDFHALINVERQKIQEGGFSSLALGETIPVSGIAATRLWESNYVKLILPTKSFSRGLKSLLNKIKSLAVGMAPDMPISLLSNYPKAAGNVILTGSQLAPYTLAPDLFGDLPMDEFRRKALGLQLVQLGDRSPLSMETVLEDYFDIEQPEEELQKKLVDFARQSRTIQLIQTWQYLMSQGFNIPFEMLAQIEGVMGGAPQGQQQRQRPGEVPSTVMSPYEPGISTLAETEFQGGPPYERYGFLRGAAAAPSGLTRRFG